MDEDLFLGALQGSEVPDAKRQYLHLSDDDRKLGMHVIGSPGSGKSKFLEHLIRQDILAGRGLCLIDPHGELYENVLEWCAYTRLDREIIPLNASRGEHIVGFNPLLRAAGDVAAHVDRCLEAILKAWGAANSDQSPRLDRILGALLTAIIEADDLTLCEADYFIEHHHEDVRRFLTSRIADPHARGNWLDLLASKKDAFNEQVESTRNRLGRFLRAQTTRRFFALHDPAVNLDLRAIMDRGAVLLVNLKWSDEITRTNARLFGSLLVNAFVQAALRREVGSGREPRPFYLYLDEFQNFVTRDIGEAVTQVRKFGLRFVLSHQLLKQLRDPDADVLDEVITAIKARAVFGGLKSTDAAELVPDLFPGQIDFHEVKRIDYTVKFWPVYDRDQVIAKGKAQTEGSSYATGSSHFSSSMIGGGQQWLPQDGFFSGWIEGAHLDSHSDGSGYGSISSESSMSATTASESVANVPIYRPEPVIEGEETPWSLEEQKHRLTDTLIVQYMRHCFFKPPNGRARPLLVPFVERYPVFEREIRAYEAEMAHRARAFPPETVDQLIKERRNRIETAAREFAAKHKEPVHSKDDEQRRPTTTGTGRKLKPRPKAAPKGTDRPEE